MLDPNRWQPLQLEHMISQNGIPVTNGVQQFVGSHWGGVKGFALPGTGAAAVHDAAVGAWGAKGYYDSARPISMIRYLGGRAQLPLVAGLIGLDQAQNVIRAWHPGGVSWIRAVDWVPYQAPMFVTPAFAGVLLRAQHVQPPGSSSNWAKPPCDAS